ncbi:MAG: hypothetical protein CMJ94_14385 [Planctomycetes bacterium]|nr:hypothetical protein [Planctomycetota bacterium]
MSPTPQRMLIVDDEDLVCDMLYDYFVSHPGLELLKASHGGLVEELIQEQPISILLTDIVMPERDGLELVMLMRDRYPEVHVIAISAPSNTHYLDAAKRLGATYTFEKPLDLEALGRAVDELLSDP